MSKVKCHSTTSHRPHQDLKNPLFHKPPRPVETFPSSLFPTLFATTWTGWAPSDHNNNNTTIRTDALQVPTATRPRLTFQEGVQQLPPGLCTSCMNKDGPTETLSTQPTRLRPTYARIVRVDGSLSNQLLQLRAYCRSCSPRCQLQTRHQRLRHWQKRRTMSARYRILGQLQTATFWHMGGRLELPKEAQTHRRPPTFFGSVHPHPRGNPQGLFSHVLWLGQLIGFNFGGHAKGPRRFGT